MSGAIGARAACCYQTPRYLSAVDSPAQLEYAAPPPPSPATDRRAFLAATGALTLVCILWGYSFPVMQFATAAFDRHVIPGDESPSAKLASRAAFNGVRFGLSAALYWLVTRRRQRGFARNEILGGVAVGAFFGGGMLLQVTGLRWALPSVSSFLTALAVVFTPLAQALVFRRPVGAATWLAVALALIGLAFFSWPNPNAAATNTLAATPPFPYLGEILTVAASIVFTGQILSLDRFGQNADAVRLTLIMLATTSLLSLVAAPIIHPPLLRADFTGLTKDPVVWWTMGTLIAVSSVLALHLMNRYQPLVSPATASVIYCTEPLFGTLFSLAFATERLTILTILGGVAVVASVLVVARAGQRRPTA
jgi:drug/metabolite transporter (DMT)-like permease